MKERYKIELNEFITNQDNSTVWINPILKTRLGKLLLLLCCIPAIFIMYSLGWKQIFLNHTTICLMQFGLLLASIIYVIITYIISKIKVYNLEDNLKTVDYEYYREILEETSSGVLSYVYNKRLNYKDILIATLLVLEKKSIIKIYYQSKNISILSSNFNQLSEYEQYIMRILKFESTNGTIQFSKLKYIITNEIFEINVIELIKKAAKDKGYYRTKNFTLNVLAYAILINFIITIVNMFKYPEVGALCLFNTLILFFLSYIENKKMYIQTKSGKTLCNKLHGLKLFLTDYSAINDRKIEEITLWDYYIIYAIIFNLKGKLNKDVNSLYDLLQK